MSLETQIAALVAASNSLTAAINGKVTEINAKVKTATDSVPAVIRSLSEQSFYIDAVNGLDTNTGGYAAPLKTAAEAAKRAVNGGYIKLYFKSAQTHEVNFLLQTGLVSCFTYDASDVLVKAQRATLKPALNGVDLNGQRLALGFGVLCGQIYFSHLNIVTDYNAAEPMAPNSGFIRYTNSRTDLLFYRCDINLSDIPFMTTYTGYSSRDLFLADSSIEVKAGKEATAKLIYIRNSPNSTLRLEVYGVSLVNTTWASLLPAKSGNNLLTNLVI